MILKRGEEYTPILFTDNDKKYLKLKTNHNAYLNATNSYKFSVLDKSRYVMSRTRGYDIYYEGFGVMNSMSGKIYCIVVEKNGIRYMIVRDSFGYPELGGVVAHRKRLMQSISVHGVNKKNVITMDGTLLDREFIFTYEYGINDLSSEVQSVVMNNISKQLKQIVDEN